MRKIVVLEFITLDGVIQAPGGPEEDTANNFKYGGWTAPYFDEMSGKEMEKQMKGEYDLLLGRKTYDIWAGYWPHHSEGWPQVNKITKYVVSKTLKDPSWEHTVVINDIDELKKLKNSDAPYLQVYGSANLVQTLMEYDLVDEFWLKIFPVTLGMGKRLFENGTIPAAFKLFESKITPSGVIIASFRRAGEVKTGSMV
jgi:dihydrofolate reductase